MYETIDEVILTVLVFMVFLITATLAVVVLS